MSTSQHKQYKLAPGLFVMLSKKETTAKIVRSPDAAGDIIIPRYFKHKFKQYIITKIDNEAFYQNDKIESISFANDSELESIGKEAFFESTLKHLSLPPTLRHFDPDWNRSTRHLEDIDVASSHFAWVDGKFFLGKSKEGGDFDTLLFAGRKIEGSITIPACVKFIGPRAFQWCEGITSISFDSIQLQEIGYGAFNNCTGLERVEDVPALVKDTGYGSFCGDSKLCEITFLGDELVIRQDCFGHCSSLAKLAIPNSIRITVDIHAFDEINNNFSLYIPSYTEVTGQGAEFIENRIERVTTEEVTNRVASLTSSISAPTIDNFMSKQGDLFQISESKLLNLGFVFKRVRYLEDKLSRYEKVTPLDISAFRSQLSSDSSTGKSFDNVSDDYEVDDNDNDNDNQSSGDDDESVTNLTFDENEKKSFKVISKICEDEISILCKCHDLKNKSIVFKKVYKDTENNQFKERIKNVIKRYKILHAVQHPCIIKAIAIDTHEKVPKIESHHSHKIIKKSHFTTAVYLEYLEFSLKDCILNHVLSNTLKARIAVEVACGISHLHHRGMIIHDLCLDNIKLNGVYNAKIASLGLTDSSKYFNEIDDEETKLDGTEEFMSPELANKSEFTNKTDVYSYGVILYSIFNEKLPKQTIQNKVAGKPMRLSTASDSISEFCLSLIEKCLQFSPAERPSIDDVLGEMKDHSYDLAAEIDSQLVLKRHRALNRFEAQHPPAFQFT